MFCFYDGEITVVYFGNFEADFFDNFIRHFLEAVGDNNIKNEICVHGAVNNSEIMYAELRVNVLYDIICHFF